MPPLQTTADNQDHPSRTRAGIVKARKNGVAWGSHGAVLAEKNQEHADAVAEAMRPVLLEICSMRGMLGPGDRIAAKRIADELNTRGYATEQGNDWHPTTVRRVILRLGTSFTEAAKKSAKSTAKAHLKQAIPEGHPLWKKLKKLA